MLEEYRASFHIYILGPPTDLLKKNQGVLESLGYSILRFDSLSEALSEISSCPPHFVVFSEKLPKRDLISILATLSRLLPETHFLTFGKRSLEFPSPELFDLGLEGHVEESSSPAEIRKTFDQRVQLELDRYSLEQGGSLTEFKFADYLKAIKSENPFNHFISHLTLGNSDDVLVYLRYFSARHALAVIAGKGGSSFEGLGIDLTMEKNFNMDQLANPNDFELIREFVADSFGKSCFEARTIGYQNEPIGILVLASNSPDCKSRFQDHWVDALEMIYSLQFMKSRLQNLDHFCPETEALSLGGFAAEAKKELARSRRLEQPTSLIALQVDHWEELSQGMNSIQKKNWLRALYRFLTKYSRINDSVGRIADGMFAVLLPHTPVEGAKLKADRLRELISNAELKVGGQVKRFTLSCGVSEYPRISTDPESLVESAVQAIAHGATEPNQSYVAPFLHRGSVDFEV